MKKIVLSGVALAALAATAAFAQPAARGGPAQPVTRAEAQARVQSTFSSADRNRDGFVTQAEARERAEARLAERQARRGERAGQLFERLDTNRDGSISRAEFDARTALRDGARTERPGMQGRRFARPGMRRGGGREGMAGGLGVRAFERLDADRDGRVSLAEANRAAMERFDRVDSNRDGRISIEEREAARAAMRARMQERRRS